jgi:hypothetical protein
MYLKSEVGTSESYFGSDRKARKNWIGSVGFQKTIRDWKARKIIGSNRVAQKKIGSVILKSRFPYILCKKTRSDQSAFKKIGSGRKARKIIGSDRDQIG